MNNLKKSGYIYRFFKYVLLQFIIELWRESMKRVKITILKTTLDKELAEEYGVPGLTACPMMQKGQVFYADYAKPEGFCDEAWKAIYQYVFALAHGAEKELFYYGDWIKKPGVAICSCNDGLRPVIMKLETTDEEAEINYTPIDR